MNTSMMALAVGLTRWWVRLYTAGPPPEVRDDRRDMLAASLVHYGAI